MADTETTTETPAETQPVAEVAPVEQTPTTVDPEAQLLEVLDGLATDESATGAVPPVEEPKKDGDYEPLGVVTNRP
ncbi:hypothetical protein [Kitasatospora sp. NPDC002040]|uniref:hypothetical protein n=1 Tax=Kitasatospora sp. NPDC002040 TaxID=3154661 RepID=UPI00332334CF